MIPLVGLVVVYAPIFFMLLTRAADYLKKLDSRYAMFNRDAGLALVLAGINLTLMQFTLTGILTAFLGLIGFVLIFQFHEQEMVQKVIATINIVFLLLGMPAMMLYLT